MMRSRLARVLFGLFVFTSIAATCRLMPIELETDNVPISDARIVSGPSGHVVANWMRSDFDLPFPNDIVARIFTPGIGWAAPENLTAGDTYPQDAGHFAVDADGTVIAVWDEIPAVGYDHILVSRKFVPGRGWGPKQTLGLIWAFPSPTMSPDGRAHLVYLDGSQFVARTLTPGEDVWSEPFVLLGNQAQSGGSGQVVAANGFAYATLFSVTEDENFIQDHGIYLAKYGPEGWSPAERISDPNLLAAGSTLLLNNGHVVLTWDEQTFPLSRHVRRLTDSLDTFSATPLCSMALDTNGTLLEACDLEGDPVPDCFRPSRSEPQPFHYSYIETRRRGLTDDQWSAPEIASDVHRRTDGTRAFADGNGNGFLVWRSYIPCSSGSVQILAKDVPLGECSRKQETVIDEFMPAEQTYGTGFDATVDGQGTLHVIWAKVKVRTEGEVPAHFDSVALTASLSARRDRNEDVNGDGTVDCTDVSIVRASLGKKTGEPGFETGADVSGDGIVDVRDLAAVAQKLPTGTQCP